MGLISPLRRICSANVIVISGKADRRKGFTRTKIVPFYRFPMSEKQILEAVEEAVGLLESSR